MPPRPPRTFWRRCRVWFRRFRIGAWLLALALVCAGLYVNQIGLPDFIKRRLLEPLRERGVDLEFSRLRLLWYRGIVAENVRFGRATETTGPSLSAKLAELNLNWRALLRGRWEVAALGLHGGRGEWPVAGSNASLRTLVIEDIESTLRLLPGDAWALDDFRARFAGARFMLAGTLTNASALRELDFLRSAPTPASGTARDRLGRFAEALEQMSFATPPELSLFVAGDARDPRTLTVRLALVAPEAATPWGQFSGGRLNARLFAATADTLSRAEATLEAAQARTPWADASRLALELKLDSVPGQTKLVTGHLTARAITAHTRWATATNVLLKANWTHALTNPIPLSGQADLRAASTVTPWGRGRNAHLAVTMTPATNVPPADASWAWWTNLQPYQLTWKAGLGGLEAENFVADRISAGGSWCPPGLTITNFHAELYHGTADGRAQLDIATREATFEIASTFDAHEFGPLLTEGARRWLDKFSWASPPHARGSGAIVLPAWTNREPDWRGEVLPTLRLAGEFAVTNAAYLGVAADWAQSHVSYTNQVWRLPDLEVGRPEGGLRLAHQADGRTKEFSSRIRSTMDLGALRPLLSTNAVRGLDLFTFTTPPVIDGEVWGRFNAPERTGGRARVALSNFTFRGEAISACATEFAYTNQVLEFFGPQVWRAEGHARADGVTVNLTTQFVHLTNAFSTVDPGAGTRCIGPKVARSLGPYHFAQPPTVRLDGTVPLHGNAGSDLHVAVSGGPFEWWKFKVPWISGTVHWHDPTVTLTNVTMAFYGGGARGWGLFDTSVELGTGCQFSVAASNVTLHALMADLTTPTNRLEGTARATLTITHANSEDWRSWHGYGDAQLRDGLIWEIPIFGVLSGPLDGIVPGLGSSRMSEGSAQFFLTNGVIFSNNLEMRAPTMRLQYVGTVDLQGRVDAVVQAEPWRDAWLVGRVVSLALWPVSKIFEFKVSGTLDKPQAQPLYIPKLFLLPLHPFRALKELFPEGASSRSNAPPANKDQ